MRNFGVGGVYLIPAGANPTPINFAILKDVTVEFKYDLKELRGQYQFPIDIARGPGNISIKAKFADVRASVLTALLAGATSVGGEVTNVFAEVGQVPGTPYQITVANGATFKEDVGVLDVTAGKWLARVASAPATGQYSVNTGTGLYTFAAADTLHNVQIFYSYSTAGAGQTITLNNSLMGPSTAFACRVWNVFGGKPLGLYFPAVHFPKLAMALKAEDWVEHDVEGMVVQDSASSLVVTAYTGE